MAPDSAQCYLRGITFCLNSKREKGEKPGQKETDATKNPAQKGVQKGVKKTQAEDDDVQKASPTFGVSKNLKYEAKYPNVQISSFLVEFLFAGRPTSLPSPSPSTFPKSSLVEVEAEEENRRSN